MSDNLPARRKSKALGFQEHAERRVKAFQLEQRIKQDLLIGYAAWFDLAKSLYEFHKEESWKDIDPDFRNLNDWLAQPDIGLSRSSFFEAVHVYRDLVVTRKLPVEKLKQIEPSKVAEVTPAIMKGDVKPEAALADAKVLGWRDLRHKYRHEKGKSPALNAAKEPERVQCETCQGQGWVLKKNVVEGKGKEKSERSDSKGKPVE